MIIFIDENYLKNNTTLCGNIDSTELVPYISEAQHMYIKPILGVNLFNDLQSKIQTNELSQSDVEVLDFVAKPLALYTTYLALPTLHLKLRNKGILKQSGDNSQNADLKEIQWLRQEFLNRASFYIQKLVEHLGKNNCETRTNDGFNSPFYFGDN
jgi:hypothetical protein